MKSLLIFIWTFLIIVSSSNSILGQSDNQIWNPSFTPISGTGELGWCDPASSQTEYWDNMPFWQLPRAATLAYSVNSLSSCFQNVMNGQGYGAYAGTADIESDKFVSSTGLATLIWTDR